MLDIKNLRVTADGTEILRGVNLSIGAGEVHAIMGPNGSGKSTLSNVLAGHPDYEVTEGEILFEGQDIAEWEVEERANAGLFMAFQYPVEIPGVATLTFLRAALNAKRKSRGDAEITTPEFIRLTKDAAKKLHIDFEMLKRPVNVGFSGGEKKRNEVLQMQLLKPKFCVLDETDSGLDIDALQVAAAGVNTLRSTQTSFLVITHYQRLLNYIIPDHVHILSKGKIVRSGGKELALELEKNGYRDFVEDAA